MRNLKTTRFELEDNDSPRNQHLITTIVVNHGHCHDVVRIWNRGACCGDLRVKAGDGTAFATTLLHGLPIKVTEETVDV